MSVQVGDKAPQFALKDKDGVIHSLASVSTPYTIVYFYPKDDTPGCTVEAKEFTRNLEMLRRAGAMVFGISGGDDRTKSRFCEKHSLSVTLLSDPDFSVAKRFGAFGEKQFMGRKYLGVMRYTYVVNREGIVVGFFDQVDPQTHAEQLLQFLRAGAVMARPQPVETDPTTGKGPAKSKKKVRRKAAVAKAVKKAASRRPPSRSVKRPKPAAAKKRPAKRAAASGGGRKAKKR